MISIDTLKQETKNLVEEAWVTLGMPFDLSMIEEKNEGIIDVEALSMATLLVMGKDRLVTDLPAWFNRFSNLINYQKLKTIFRGLSEQHRKLIRANLKHINFYRTPKAFKNVFNLRTREPGSADETVTSRISKINTIENVTQTSLIIKNRLLYGTSFRADLITLTHIKRIGMKGTELAELLSANNSTISRILSDLKACKFLNNDKERLGPFESYPGMFLSVVSLRNLCEMIDATQFCFEELQKGVLENLDFKHDAFGKIISNKFSKSFLLE